MLMVVHTLVKYHLDYRNLRFSSAICDFALLFVESVNIRSFKLSWKWCLLWQHLEKGTSRSEKRVKSWMFLYPWRFVIFITLLNELDELNWFQQQSTVRVHDDVKFRALIAATWWNLNLVNVFQLRKMQNLSVWSIWPIQIINDICMLFDSNFLSRETIQSNLNLNYMK